MNTTDRRRSKIRRERPEARIIGPDDAYLLTIVYRSPTVRHTPWYDTTIYDARKNVKYKKILNRREIQLNNTTRVEKY